MDDRLPALMRMVLGATTDGERLAALAAFGRVMAASGLDMHAVADLLSTDRPGRPPPESRHDPWDDPSVTHPAAETQFREMAGVSARWREAAKLVRQFGDDDWEPLAIVTLREDDAWHAAHGRWLLSGRQRRFVEQMRDQAPTVRLTLAQSVWLLLLATTVSDQTSRPDPVPVNRMGDRPAPAAARGERELPPRRPRPAPRRVTTRIEQLAWIAAIIAARHHDGGGPLFTDAQVRILVWIAARLEAWTIDRGDRHITVGKPPSAAEVAAATHTHLSTVRTALACAVVAGVLVVETAGGGRGKRTRYLLAEPPDGWRHHRLDVASARRQSGRIGRAKLPPPGFR